MLLAGVSGSRCWVGVWGTRYLVGSEPMNRSGRKWGGVGGTMELRASPTELWPTPELWREHCSLELSPLGLQWRGP